VARGLAMIGMLAATACGETRTPGAETIPVPVYLGSEKIRLTDDLVNVRADAAVAGGAEAARAYAECLAAGYAVSRGFGFARHVSTALSEEGGVWRADAVYTVSPALPAGVRTIDAETKVAACGESGIPTV
jgi:hypothetical protein